MFPKKLNKKLGLRQLTICKRREVNKVGWATTQFPLIYLINKFETRI